MDSHEGAILLLEREVGDALTRRDVDALQRLFADDFSGINPVGAEIAKADIIASAESPDYEPESIVNDVRHVRMFDGVAVVTAQGTARGKYRGQRANMVFVYTRIWVKRDGVWQAVAAHASPVG
jgi:ketosteroid isomerase-like protein